MHDEFYDLKVFDTPELSEALGGDIISREKLHHWPLSYVEKVSLGDGRTVVCKFQNPAASVENRFYASARAKFLLEPVFSQERDGWSALCLPYVEHAPYSPGSREELLGSVGRWSAMLQELPDAPVYFDISSREKLSDLLEYSLEVFPEDDPLLPGLRRWVEKDAELCYRGQPIGLLHGDLNGGNIVADGGELRYILDWQRPIRGPLPLDAALALESAGFPLPEDDPFGRLGRVFSGI